jgi:hypothetical protein
MMTTTQKETLVVARAYLNGKPRLASTSSSSRP